MMIYGKIFDSTRKKFRTQKRHKNIFYYGLKLFSQELSNTDPLVEILVRDLALLNCQVNNVIIISKSL